MLTLEAQHRQNLNEVENLYFHHSHTIRGPKPQATLPVLDPNHESGSMNAPHSSCMESAYVLQGPRHETTEIRRSSSSVRSEVNITMTSLSPVTQHRDSLVQIDVPSRPPVEEALTNNAVVPPVQQQSSYPNSHFGASTQGIWNDKMTPRPSPQVPAPSISHSISSNLQQPSTNSLPASVPNTALTYDSFWSNHNATRPFRSSFFNMLSSSDIETNKITTQALLAGLSGKNINTYLSNLTGLTSDFITASPSPPSDITPTTTPTIRRTVAVASTVEGLKDQ